MCTLFIPDEDKVVSVACDHLEPVLPDKGDKVGFISHQLDLGFE